MKHVGKVSGGFGFAIGFQVDPLRGALGAPKGADHVVAPQRVRDFRGAHIERSHFPGVEPDAHGLLQAVVLDALNIGYRRQSGQDVPLDQVTDTGIGALWWNTQCKIKARIGGIGTTDLYRRILGALWQFKTNLAQSRRQGGNDLGRVLIQL